MNKIDRVHIRRFQNGDEHAVAAMIADFRVALSEFAGRVVPPDLAAAELELKYYRDQNFPIFVALSNGVRLGGFGVCRVIEDVVWGEALYVLPEYRRKGIATALYRVMEQVATTLGGPTLYNWIHPNNDTMIAFLAKQGYKVLNLIEIRKPYESEQIHGRIKVGEHCFDYGGLDD